MMSKEPNGREVLDSGGHSAPWPLDSVDGQPAVVCMRYLQRGRWPPICSAAWDGPDSFILKAGVLVSWKTSVSPCDGLVVENRSKTGKYLKCGRHLCEKYKR